jgi:hypothetical protein
MALCIIPDDQFQLPQFRDGLLLLVVFVHLIGQEIHAVAVLEALGKAFVELGCRKRHQDTPLDVEGNHPIKEHVRLPLGDGLALPFV